MDIIIDDFGKFDSIQRMDNLLQIEVQALGRNVRRVIEDIMRDLKARLRDLITDFINDVVRVSRRYIEDVNINNYLRIVRTEIGLEINEAQSFNWNFDADDGVVFSFFRWLDVGIFNCFTNSHNKDYWHSKVNTLRKNDMSHYFNEIRSQKDSIIQSLRCKLIEELITPIKSQYNDVKTQKVDRASMLQELIRQREELRDQLSRVEEQLQRIGIVSASHE